MNIIDNIRGTVVSTFVSALALTLACCSEAELADPIDNVTDKVVDYYLMKHDTVNYQYINDYDSESGLTVGWTGNQFKFVAPDVEGHWEIEIPYSSRTWCSADKYSGDGAAEICVDMSENPGYVQRASEFTFITKNNKVKVSFKQNAAPEPFKSIFDDASSFFLSWNDPQELVVTVKAFFTSDDASVDREEVFFGEYNLDGKAAADGVDIQTNLDAKGWLLKPGTLTVRLQTYTDYESSPKVEAEYVDDVGNSYTDEFIANIKTPFDGGDGSASLPFQLSKARHLMRMADFCANNSEAVNFVQTADIACPDGVNFTPTGASKIYPFKGVYDGGGFMISNYFVDYSIDAAAAGLFGFADGATVKNLTMKNPNISAPRHVGAIIGYATGDTTVSNCELIAGEVTGYGIADPASASTIFTTKMPFGSAIIDEGYGETDDIVLSKNVGAVGGVVGSAINTAGSGKRITIENCNSSCYVHGRAVAWKSANNTSENWGRYGGIVGYARNGVDVKNCSSTNATGAYYTSSLISNPQHNDILVGGVVAVAMNDVNITDCYNTGVIAGSGFVGGILGYGCDNVHLRRCYCDDLGDETKLMATAANTGVLVGVILGSNNSIYQCYTNMMWVGGPTGPSSTFAGVLSNTDVAYCYSIGKLRYTSNSNGTLAPLVASLRIGANYANNIHIHSCFAVSQYVYMNGGGKDIASQVFAKTHTMSNLVNIFGTQCTNALNKQVVLSNLAAANFNTSYTTDYSYVYPVVNSNSATNATFISWLEGYADQLQQYDESTAEMCTEEFITDVLGDTSKSFWQYNAGALPTLKANVNTDIVFPAE